jgi:hypothetical protein
VKIIFTDITDSNLELPLPASKHLPEWYKKLPTYTENKKIFTGYGEANPTVKKCMPVFDAITAGYIITLPVDVYVSIKNNNQYFEWPSRNAIEFHNIIQAPTHPLQNGYAYPKFMNPWGIKTPKGYSTLIVQPFHRESVFTIMPGIVDTDKYFVPINFPFVINDKNFEGLIPCGTPIAQVIPFKRDSWKNVFGNKKNVKEIEVQSNDLSRTFFNRYKRKFQQLKEYI